MNNKLKNKTLPTIGVDKFCFAELLSDTTGELPEYGDVVEVPGVTEVGFNPNSQISTFYADNSPYATAAQTGDLVLTVGLAGITNEITAKWFGQKYENGVLEEGQIKPINMAVGFRRTKSDGTNVYYWHYKAMASPAQETSQTQGASVNFQAGSIQINCSTLVSTGKHRLVIEDTDKNLPEGVTPAIIETNFFSSPLWRPEAAGGGDDEDEVEA